MELVQESEVHDINMVGDMDVHMRHWLGMIEAFVLKRIGELSAEELEVVNQIEDIDSFFARQSEEVKYAVNICVAAQGHGIEELLASLSSCELV